MADVLIVGAGPVGLTLAVALRQQGITCRIIDKGPEPSDKSKALVIWSRTLELLDELSLADTFVAEGMKIRGASIYGGGKRLVHIEMAGIASRFNFPLMIPQNKTELLLTERLTADGGAIERGVELLTFNAEADEVISRLRHVDGHEEIVATPWLAGCDGAHSTVRHTLGMTFSGVAEPNNWILADVRIDGPIAGDEISIFWHETGVLAIFPIERGRFRAVADAGAAISEQPAPTLAEVQAKVDERGPGGLVVSQPTWLANFHINERKVADYRQGRVVLAGDAAHIHSPAGGQGMNTGMQDAVNLAWKLALVQKGRGQIEPLLTSYSLERSAIGDQVLRAAELMTTVATLRNPTAQFLRNHIAPIVTSFGAVKDKITNAMSELTINYRLSPLSVNDGPRLSEGLHAGDRLIDCQLSAPDGAETSLFTELRGLRQLLLLLPAAQSAQAISDLAQLAAGVERIFPELFTRLIILSAADDRATAHNWSDTVGLRLWYDTTDRLREQFGVRENAVLVVRPDGYLGYRGQPADGAALLQYLHSYLLPMQH